MNQSFKQIILGFNDPNDFLTHIDPEYLGLVVIESIRNILADYVYNSLHGVQNTEEYQKLLEYNRTNILATSVDYIFGICRDASDMDSEPTIDLLDLDEINDLNERIISEITNVAVTLAQSNPEGLLVGMVDLLWSNGEPLFPNFTARFIRDKIYLLMS